MNDIDKYSNSTRAPVKIIVGNKCDMIDDRVISKDRGQELADEYEVKFFESSAKADHNVDAVFYELATDIYKKKQNELKPKPDSIDLRGPNDRNRTTTCKCNLL